MSAKKSEKKSIFLEAEFESILVCNNKDVRPMIEVFVFEPENIDQKGLGTFFGIFEVADSSEDSSYVVNYLLSIIKKEYFSKPKRPAVESFEAALHKGNLALSKIAEHGNVSWIGKLNAIIAIFEKNNLHLTQVGSTSAFLFRGDLLNNISENLSSEDAHINPLKTFINVSSGRLEKNDKLIILTKNVFDIFSIEEIRKSILRFSPENFVRFLQTALVNELQKSGALIIDVREKMLAPAPPKPKKTPAINAFSQDAFIKKSSPQNNVEEEKEKILAQLQKEKINSDEERNKKIGHIYIKESSENEEEKISSAITAPVSQKKIIVNILNNTTEKLDDFRSDAYAWSKKIISRALIQARSVIKNIFTVKEKIRPIKFRLPKFAPHIAASKEKLSSSVNASKWREYYTVAKEKTRSIQMRPARFNTFYNILNSWKNTFFSIMPDFSKLKILGAKLTAKQRTYVVFILLTIVIVPWIFVHYFDDTQSHKSNVQITNELADNPNQDKNITRLEKLETVYNEDGLIRVINARNSIFVISKSKITNLQTKESSSIPDDFGSVKLTTAMNDLNLIFLLNNQNSLLSYSPISKKFQPANINWPANINISAIGTYMTYLYAVDTTSNQIYRFPRAADGFGDKTNWIKDGTDISKTQNMSISNSIFLVANNSIIKLFNYIKKDFAIEDTYHAISPMAVYADADDANVFVFDQKNSKIAKLDSNGQIQKQYYNAEIANATDFVVSETSNTVYLVIGNDVKTFSLEK